MTDQPQSETPVAQDQPAAPKPGGEVAAPADLPPRPLPPPLPPPPDPGDAAPGIAATLEERPELAAGAAFAGGLILALILKRLAR